MISRTFTGRVLAAAILLSAPAVAQDRIAAIQVHGNKLTPEVAVIEVAGVRVGDAFTEATLGQVADRLRRDGRFQRVDTFKRYASIVDASQITVLILVDEGPVSVDRTSSGGFEARRRRGPPLMYFPILEYDDGYGLAYGLKTTWPDVAGRGSRLSVPLSWGATRQVQAEGEVPITKGAKSRASGGVGLTQQHHPFYDTVDRRRREWVRVEADVTRQIRVGSGVDWQRIEFLDRTDGFARVSVDGTADTRLDPFLSRNAVFVRLSREWLRDSTTTTAMWHVDARGYVGLPYQAVVVARVEQHIANRPLPPPFQHMLGGDQSLRGRATGSAVGDNAALGSLELRWPLSSPLSLGKLGLSGFIDAGTVYPAGQRLSDQQVARSFGGAVWITAAAFRASVTVGREYRGGTRAHVALTAGL